MNKYNKDTRTELHKTQEKVNTNDKKVEGELAVVYMILIGTFFWLAVLSLAFDNIARSRLWHYTPGIGWQQGAVAIVSIILCAFCFRRFLQK